MTFHAGDLNPYVTFTYELNPYPLKIYQQTKNELSTSRLSKLIVLQTYIQTPPKHYHAASLAVKFTYLLTYLLATN